MLTEIWGDIEQFKIELDVTARLNGKHVFPIFEYQGSFSLILITASHWGAILFEFWAAQQSLGPKMTVVICKYPN